MFWHLLILEAHDAEGLLDPRRGQPSRDANVMASGCLRRIIRLAEQAKAQSTGPREES